MAKKEPTAKQLAARKAAGERMRAMHAAKKAQKEAEAKAPAPELTGAFTQEFPSTPEQAAPVVAPPAPEPQPAPQPEPAPQPQMQPAMAMTMEQFEMLLSKFSGNNEPKVQGVGIIERFPLKAENYLDPRDDLYEFPRFQRYGMRYN